jgi:cell division protein FtsN
VAAETDSGSAPTKEMPVPETFSPSTAAMKEAPKEKPEERPLEWYKSMSGKGETPEITVPPAVKPIPIAKEKAASPTVTPATKPPAKIAAASSSYTVQVGAFRQKKQVDAKAEVLRSKGFDCRIEFPESEEGLYLLKVGRFKSRAEAVAMQLRLKKNGWSSFIKTN